MRCEFRGADIPNGKRRCPIYGTRVRFLHKFLSDISESDEEYDEDRTESGANGEMREEREEDEIVESQSGSMRMWIACFIILIIASLVTPMAFRLIRHAVQDTDNIETEDGEEPKTTEHADTVQSEYEKFSSDDWICHEVKVNGKIIELPCSVNEWEDGIGASLSYSFNQTNLAPGGSVSILYDGPVAQANVRWSISNISEDSLRTSECVVTSVSVDDTMGAAETIRFPGGVAIGCSINSATESWGEPSSVEYGEEEDLYSWQQETGETCIVRVENEMNRIVGITITTK